LVDFPVPLRVTGHKVAGGETILLVENRGFVALGEKAAEFIAWIHR